MGCFPTQCVNTENMHIYSHKIMSIHFMRSTLTVYMEHLGVGLIINHSFLTPSISVIIIVQRGRLYQTLFSTSHNFSNTRLNVMIYTI